MSGREGGTVLLDRGRGAQEKVGVAFARRYWGPYVNRSKTPGVVSGEAPFAWRDPRGVLHALLHVNSNSKAGPALPRHIFRRALFSIE